MLNVSHILTAKAFRALQTLLLAMVVISGQPVLAGSDDNVEPQQFAEQLKDRLITVIKDREKYEQEGGVEAYYQAVQEVLEPVVDFRFIAGAVMNRYYKEASQEQRAEFAEVFKKGLVATYANGMAGFVDYDMTIIPPNGDIEGKNRVSVGLEVKGKGSVNRVSFTLRRDDEKGWQLINMVLNGTNFGALMQKQFAQAMKQSENNIDSVIAGWTSA